MRTVAACLALGVLSSLAVAQDTKTTTATKATDKKEAKPATTISFSTLLGLGGGTPAKTAAQKKAEEGGTHREVAPIKVQSSDGKLRLQTLAVDTDGRLVTLVAPPRGYGAATKGATGEVHVFDAAGKPAAQWKVNFHAHSINTGPDGCVYVAGDGKVAKFDKAGKELLAVELPYIKEALGNKEAMKKDAEAEIKEQKEQFLKSVETYKKRIEDLKAIDEAKRTALQKRQLTQFESILKSFAQTEKFYESRTVEAVVAEKAARMGIINGIAVSEKDVFVACGEAKGYGYAVWRMDPEFKTAKRVLAGLGGCCGQMDVQCCGDGDLLVAENTKHQFARYDRDGKRKGSHGKRGTPETDVACFGGCCNPMNVRATKGDEVYTAESEGLIKRFKGDGEFAGVVGYAPLTGGCKNVAVAVSPDGARVYFADQPGSRVVVLEKK